MPKSMLLIMQLQTITLNWSNCISTAQQFAIYNLHYKVIISATVHPHFSPFSPNTFAKFPPRCLANEVQNQRDVHRNHKHFGYSTIDSMAEWHLF